MDRAGRIELPINRVAAGRLTVLATRGEVGGRGVESNPQDRSQLFSRQFPSPIGVPFRGTRAQIRTETILILSQTPPASWAKRAN